MIGAPYNLGLPYPRTRPGEQREITWDVMALAEVLGGIGVFVRPDQDLQRAIGLLGSRGGGPGGRIFLLQGEWFFKGTLNIEVPGVDLFCLSPARTVFHRASASHTDGIIHIEADDVRIHGIRFNDLSLDQPSIVVHADTTGVQITGCQWDDCFQAVKVEDGDCCLIADNYIKAGRGDKTIHLEDATIRSTVSRNKVISGAVDEIYGSDTAADNLFDGNHCGAAGSINYKGAGLGNVGDATNNKATVTVRP